LARLRARSDQIKFVARLRESHHDSRVFLLSILKRNKETLLRELLGSGKPGQPLKKRSATTAPGLLAWWLIKGFETKDSANTLYENFDKQFGAATVESGAALVSVAPPKPAPRQTAPETVQQLSKR
jgi:hypothetical protein